MPAAGRVFFWVWVVGLSAITLGSAALIATWTVAGHGPPVFFIVVWLIGGAWIWYYALIAGCIEATLWPEDGRLQFRSLVRERETNVADVVNVDMGLHGLNQRSVIIRYRRGYRRPAARLPNVRSTWDLVERIEASNPTVEVKRRPVDPWRATP
jgi:hypothetical protein